MAYTLQLHFKIILIYIYKEDTMIVEKPFFISNRVENRNYESIVRTHMGDIDFKEVTKQASSLSNPHDFTELLRASAEQEGQISSSVNTTTSTTGISSTTSAPLAAPAGETASSAKNIDAMPTQGIPLRGIAIDNQAISLYGGNGKAVGLKVTDAISLDLNSLFILERVSRRTENQEQSLAVDKNQNSEIGKNQNSEANQKSTLAQILLGQNDSVHKELGQVSAKFESAGSGIDVIGYDRVGGTSYGKYQLSSKQGSVDHFIDYLKEHEPDFANRLLASGNANTGNRQGEMPNEWKKIAAQFPERFEELQQNFAVQSYHEPVAKHLEGILGASLPKALNELVFSTSIQHGVTGAKNIFDTVLKNTENLRNPQVQDSEVNLSQFVVDTYDMRGTMFSSSSSRVQEAVKSRFSQEKNMVLALLNDQTYIA